VNSKNLDAIRRMVVRLQSILETEFLMLDAAVKVVDAKRLLEETVQFYDAHSPAQNSEEIRTD
jgi:hypothetical protein